MAGSNSADAGAGPAVLRSLRARAGLTQDELAKLAGLSVRTVRGLEAGRIARPHPRSLRRLAESLSGEPERQRELIASWGQAGAARRTGANPTLHVEEVWLTGGALEEALGHAREINETTRPVFISSVLHVDRYGRPVRAQTRLTLLALADGARYRAGIYRPGPHVQLDKVAVTNLLGCRLGAAGLRYSEREVVFDLDLGWELVHGQTTNISYDVELAKANPPPAVVRRVTDFCQTSQRAVAQPAAALSMEVRFHPDHLPSRCEQTFSHDFGAAVTQAWPTELSPHATIALSSVQPDLGVHGLRWHW